ncbi:MAG: hypothetical protein GX220_05325 [Treponema sp.]|nr:hypothetical protein [Treponema sp.]
MSIWHTLFYFCFYSSAVLIYGVGISQSIQNSTKLQINIVYECIFTTIVCIISALIVRVISLKILLPLRLQILMPLVAIIIIMPISVLINLITEKLNFVKYGSIYLTVPCVILSVTESFSNLNMIFTVLGFILSYYLLIPFIYSIRQRINKSNVKADFNNDSLTFISIVVVLCAIFAIDISWLNLGDLNL